MLQVCPPPVQSSLRLHSVNKKISYFYFIPQKVCVARSTFKGQNIVSLADPHLWAPCPSFSPFFSPRSLSTLFHQFHIHYWKWLSAKGSAPLAKRNILKKFSTRKVIILSPTSYYWWEPFCSDNLWKIQFLSLHKPFKRLFLLKKLPERLFIEGTPIDWFYFSILDQIYENICSAAYTNRYSLL